MAEITGLRTNAGVSLEDAARPTGVDDEKVNILMQVDNNGARQL